MLGMKCNFELHPGYFECYKTLVPTEIFNFSRQLTCLDLECTSWHTFIGCVSNVKLVNKTFVMLLQCYFAYQTCMLWQDSTLHSGEGRGPCPSYCCRVGMEVRVCPQTWSGRSAVLHGTAGWARKRVPIMVSAASLLQVRDEDRALCP